MKDLRGQSIGKVSVDVHITRNYDSIIDRNPGAKILIN